MDYSVYKTFAKDVLGVEYNDIELLVCAFTHRSYVNEHRKTASQHNERLEFLGDAVLELVVTSYLYSNFTMNFVRELRIIHINHGSFS